MINLSEDFWDNRYKTKETGWDLGEVSAPLKANFDQLSNKELKILIPGAAILMKPNIYTILGLETYMLRIFPKLH